MIASVVVLVTGLILSGSHAYAYASATKSLGEDPSIGRVGPKSYGSVTKGVICGDQLCKDLKSKHIAVVKEDQLKTVSDSAGSMPTIKTEQVIHYSKESPNAYIGVFRVSAGDKNLDKIQVFIQSDMEKTSVPIDGLFAKSGETIEVRVHAIDPMSILAYIGSWQYKD